MKGRDIRVVVPGASAETIVRCIENLESSSIRSDFQVVVVDDGVGDVLDRVLAPFDVHVVRTRKKGSAGGARNAGAKDFDGQVLIFVDADVLVESHAIERLVAPLQNGTADAAVGNYSRDVSGLNFCEAYKQLYVNHVNGRRPEYLSNEFWSAISAISTKAFSDMGGFCTTFQGALGEDTELGIRLTAKGYRILVVHDAMGKHLKKLNLTGLIKNDLRKGTHSFYLQCAKKTPITDFRHSGQRDIGAVVAAYLLPLSAVLSIWLPPWPILLVAVLYVYVRSDLINVYSKQRWLFLSGAIPVMYLLDIVRGACVILGAVRAGRAKQ